MRIEPRPSKDTLRAGVQAGLTLWRVLEPRFGEAELELFERAGKADTFEAVSRVPALLITLWDHADRP
jgi:hypothetical protein